MTKSKTPVKESAIEVVPFKDALGERYLAYAMSTITSRSLPDVRDGLKPVHRRLLWAMLQLKLDPASGYKKCARVVGDVIGKYHPHGDVAVYDTMVRLAQDFAVRYPLVEGQGNFGSIDGDNPAAMRYTEAKLTEVAMALLENIKDDTVDFRPTYDGSEEEPIVLPSAFPNLLANGSEGIAVGMATSIPPHNAGELCDALLHLIAKPKAVTADLLQFVQGPDFPTGGTIVESPDSILNTYETGRGAFRTRAKWEVEKLSHGIWQIVITEIPYQVQKSRLIEKMAELFRNKKLPLLGHIRDESAEDIRLILEPKSRQVDPEMLMESLFHVTELENRFNLNMNVLTADGVPQVMGLKGVLQAFLAHRHEVLVRRSNHRLDQIARRLEILGGLLIAFLNLDEVIRIIREEDDPKAKMMKKWKLSEIQVEAILNMRLRQLRKLEEIEIRKEHDALSKEQSALQSLLSSDNKRWKAIAKEITDIKTRFGQDTELGARRTDFGAAVEGKKVISIEAFVEKEPITVLFSEKGWLRALKGHNQETGDYKEGDSEKFRLNAQTTDKLLFFATNGRCYTIGADKLPRGRGHGDPIRLMIDLENDQDIIGVCVFETGQKFLLASSIGKGFIVPADDLIAQTKNGRSVMNIPDKHAANVFRLMPEDATHIACIGTSRKLLVFPLDQMVEMKKGQGVTLQKFKDGKLTDAIAFNVANGLSWPQGDNRTRTEADVTPWMGNRAGQGKLPPQGFPKNNRFD